MDATAKEESTVRVQPVRSRGGVWVVFGDEEYRVPPLNLLAIQDLQGRVETLGAMGAVPTAEQMGVITDVLHAAMARNYPAITREEVGDMLDLGNFAAAMNAALAVSGFEKRAAGEVLASQ